MPESRHHVQSVYDPALDLPPPFRVVRLREVGDAFVHARTHAAELGAGTLVVVGRFDLAKFAVVQEPEEPLASARLAFFAGMIALCDALAALAPPEKPIAIEPDAILVGGGRLAWPDAADERAVPDWLVFGATIRTVSMSRAEAGLNPLATALEEEGFGEAGSDRVLEGFARHLMMAIDRWREEGFAAIAKSYLSKFEPEDDAYRNIKQNGDLSIRRRGKPIEHRALLAALKRPSWFDPKAAGPRL